MRSALFVFLVSFLSMGNVNATSLADSILKGMNGNNQDANTSPKNDGQPSDGFKHIFLA